MFGKIFGDESSKFIKNTEKTVSQINALEADISGFKDDDFPKKTQEFKAKTRGLSPNAVRSPYCR